MIQKTEITPYFKHIARSVAHILALIFGCRLFSFPNKISSYVNTERIIKGLKKAGTDCYFESSTILIGGKHISIGNSFVSRSRLRLEAHDKYGEQIFTPEITIGNNVQMLFDNHISAINKIVIGDNVLMASRILITDLSHGQTDRESLDSFPVDRPLYSKGPVIIEDNVWIGTGAAILPGVTIGKGSVIGANAVVTHDIPEYSIVGGNPARVIKENK